VHDAVVHVDGVHDAVVHVDGVHDAVVHVEVTIVPDLRISKGFVRLIISHHITNRLHLAAILTHPREQPPKYRWCEG
jgi:hypothetical protein